MADALKSTKTGALAACFLALALVAHAQVAAPQPRTQTPAPATPIAPLAGDVIPLLGQVQQVAQSTNLDIAKLRIEKWKADSAMKQRVQQNADSISRNLTSALPGMLDQVRANPQSLAAMFNLYRDLNLVCDYTSTLADTAGMFGSKSEYDALGTDAANLENLRRAMGDKLAQMAAFRDNEITRLRTQLAQATAPPPAPPKKVVVDDEEKPKKPATRKKKPTAKPATEKPAETGTSKPQ